MKLVDSNVWLALAISDHVFHDAAKSWLKTETGPGVILFCRSTQQSFLRLITTAAVVKPYGVMPFRNKEAWALYEEFLADQRIALCAEPEGVEARWKALSVRRTPSPKLWMDAYLAAFAICGRYQFVTTDRAFAQFADLDLRLISLDD